MATLPLSVKLSPKAKRLLKVLAEALTGIVARARPRERAGSFERSMGILSCGKAFKR
jgi:hypothetical protein